MRKRRKRTKPAKILLDTYTVTNYGDRVIVEDVVMPGNDRIMMVIVNDETKGYSRDVKKPKKNKKPKKQIIEPDYESAIFS